MKSKPDNRKDNVDHIQKAIDGTIHNTEIAEEIIAETNDEKTRRDLKAKNERRRQALDGLRSEIQDEANFRDKK